MAKQTINQGTAPTGAGGDTFRSDSAKLQANDDEIYNYLGDGTNLNKLGTAAFRNTGTQAGNVMEVGAFGLGGLSTLVTQPSDVKQSGFFHTFNASDMAYCAFLNIMHSEQDMYRWQLGVPMGDATLSKLKARIRTESGWSSEAKIWNQHNTTVDSNGFIKAASPIVKLFLDKAELNDEAQQQEITFEKLGVGDYLIKGSTGFAQEGWYVETPKDANGNVLFSVIYTTLENGDISVKTYKKKFDFETVSIVADLDNPVDITENRWIDLRLQELPQPETEVTDDSEQ